jgi:hypothetical protein
VTDELRAAQAEALGEQLLEKVFGYLDPADPQYLSVAILALVGSAAACGYAAGLDPQAVVALITCTAEGAVADMERSA